MLCFHAVSRVSGMLKKQCLVRMTRYQPNGLRRVYPLAST
ncbi:hypothetical protein BX591_11049 [Paraburkholderia bryophila]|uniref:Uncharacterized protein n=1 Tax=Paraburkholderia bryophila TaxID=420952 RepID=A0A329CDU7_9BURK|nr:hypothetical protein BX591_11049 [Paraburkholderia bryophila]